MIYYGPFNEDRDRVPVQHLLVYGPMSIRRRRTGRTGQEIDNFEGGWTKNRQFMGVRTLPEALLSINKRGSVCVHKNSF